MKTLFLASMSFLLMLSCTQPEWKKKGFETEESYLKYLKDEKDNYFDSLEKVLPSDFASSSVIGKYVGHYQIITINEKGIMRIEHPVTNFSPEYVPINLNKPKLFETLYGRGLEIVSNYKYKEEDDRYKFEYHENDASFAYPIMGYTYYSDGSKTDPGDGEGYIIEGGADLFTFFTKKGFKTLTITELMDSNDTIWAKYWDASPKIQ